MSSTYVSTLLFCCSASLLVGLGQIVYRLTLSPISRIPGPWYSNVTGLVLDFYFLKGSRCQYVHALHQQYGPVVRIAPGMVNFADSKAMKAIYGTRETFRKSPFYRRLAVPGQQGLFNTVDVEFHRRHRRLLAGPIADSSLWALTPLIEARVASTLAKMTMEMESRGVIDVYQWWLRLSTDLISELTFGESFRTLEQDHSDQEKKHLLKLGEDDDAISIRVAFPTLVQFCGVLPLPFLKSSHEAGEHLTQLASQSLERQRRLWLTDPEKVQHTLLSELIKGYRNGVLPFNEILDEAQNYIAAGSDTVAVTLTFLTWAVSRDARVRSTLVEELTKLPPGFSDTHLRNQPFLNQVVNEALRMYSAAPGLLPRLVPSEGFELGGYWMEPGTEVCAQSFSLHRDPAVFPSPDTFDPSRWAHPTAAMKEAFIPFSRGARGCIGQYLARLELRLATAHFFLAFPEARVSSLEGMSDADMKPAIRLLLTPKGRRCLIQAS